MNSRNILKSVGAAIFYLSIYSLCQIVVSYAASIIIVVSVSFKYGIERIYQVMAEDPSGYMKIANEIAVEASERLFSHLMEITLISALVALLTYFIIFRVRKKKFFVEVGIKKAKKLDYPICFLLGIFLNFFVVSFLSIVPIPENWLASYADATASMGVGSLTPIAIITTVLAAPISEEIVFRGLLYTRLKRCMPMLGAMILTSFIFGIMHGTAIIWVMYAGILGFVLSWVYEKCGSLLAPILMHMGFNLVGSVSELVPAEMMTFGNTVLVFLLSLSICLLLIFSIQRRSDNKIEVAMPENRQLADDENNE